MITKEESVDIFHKGYNEGYDDANYENKNTISLFRKTVSQVLTEMNDVINSLGDK